ncbi:NAD(+) synthase [Hanamia caeni]|jgi:NAD+ synthase|uniref:NH(3)-dependent NAD(+) synthetase n=1 Tax=Hanamia caeni TaxID=2294116 RepID=A0A3M9NIB5_9BACT|nr:NAD(+) synthase [Hanamia caeni]RNI37494.1 NAD(+) synthase [Hanamia caeni]
MVQEKSTKFSKNIISINNIELKISSITQKLKEEILQNLKRKGAIVGISGGIDSSVTFALAVKALGAKNVIGVMLPEKDSNSESKELALLLANQLGVQTIEENITNALEGFGCYRRRDQSVAAIFPEYNSSDYTMKIGINPKAISQHLPPIFSLTIVDKNGQSKSRLLPAKEYLQIVAASNFKQRCRMSMLYYHAERMYYAVVGTPNKHEVEQGFFVKHGDGGADILPIAHLYKTQVYQMAEYLNIPKEIIQRTPTSDTYSAEQTQEEFFFQLPFKEMDLIWYGFENGYDPSEVCKELNRSEDEIKAIYNNFIRKQKTTEYLRMSPIKNF